MKKIITIIILSIYLVFAYIVFEVKYPSADIRENLKEFLTFSEITCGCGL